MTESDVLRKLGEIENRLSNLENGKSEKKIVKEDRTEIAEEGKLESSEMSKENGMVKVKRVPVCDHCGHQLSAFSICKRCSKKLDEKCSIEFRKQVICPDCLRGIYPLSRQGFKIMLIVANSITNQGDITRISGIPKNDVKEIVQFLIGSGYLESHMIRGHRLSERGREALFAYSQLWGGTGDMQHLDGEIKRFVFEQ
ncbi:MAG: hypothetical protein KGI27_01550 [Thaumarchaeota archaeon]|nr:hypothetical protein [Nitrososphaerota archaeon]